MQPKRMVRAIERLAEMEPDVRGDGRERGGRCFDGFLAWPFRRGSN